MKDKTLKPTASQPAPKTDDPSRPAAPENAQTNTPRRHQSPLPRSQPQILLNAGQGNKLPALENTPPSPMQLENSFYEPNEWLPSPFFHPLQVKNTVQGVVGVLLIEHSLLRYRVGANYWLFQSSPRTRWRCLNATCPG